MTKRIIALLLALILTVGLLPTVALAAETDSGTATAGVSSVSSDTDDPTNPVHIKKSVQTDDDGTGTLTLEAYVTDPMEIVTEDVPLDIVLVLDQSGSMGDCINAGCTAEYYTFGSDSGYRTGWYKNDRYVEKNTCGATSATYEWYSYVYNARPDDSNAIYCVPDGNGYRQVYYCAGGNSCTRNQGHSAGWFYDLSGSHADYGNGLFGRNDNRVRETYWDGWWENYTVIYKYVAPTSGKNHVSRLDVLKQVLASFTTKVAGKATAQANHRIAMVGFSSYETKYNGRIKNDYKNTEILTGTNLSARGDNWETEDNNIAYFPDESLNIANGKQKYKATDNDYKNALVDVSTADGKTNVSNAIKALTAYGGTYTDYGLDMAYQILNSNKPAEGSKRQQVVILFTDGETATDHKNSAKTNANKLKGLGATVYTVGLFADTQTAYDTDMSEMSSNTTEKTGYYLKASNAASLNAVFQQLTVEINKLMLTIDDKAVLHDTLSEYFDFNFTGSVTEGITIKTATVTGYNEATKEYSWQEDTDTNDYKAQPVSGSSKSFTVTGFNYKANAIRKTVEDGEEVYKGKKLIVTIPIKADTTKTSGWTAGKNYYDTNAADSAKLDNYTDEDGTARNTTLNDSPKAPVTGYTVTYSYTTDSQYKDTALPTGGTYIKGQTHKVANNLIATDYTFDGWYKKADCSDTKIAEKTDLEITGNVTLYGKFTKSVFEVDLSSFVKKELELTGVSALLQEETFNVTGTEYETGNTSFTGSVTMNKAGTEPFTCTKVNLSVGQHTFKVKENAGSTLGMNYDSTEYTLTVTVNADGTATADKVTITNTYAPEAATLDLAGKFKKVLTSNTLALPTGANSFGLTIKNGTTEVAKGTATVALGTTPDATGKFTGEANFTFINGNLTFTSAGTYNYKVTETDSDIAGMKYASEADLTIVVENDPSTGKLKVTRATINNVNIAAETGTNTVTINNTFTAAELPLDPTPDPEGSSVYTRVPIAKAMTGEATKEDLTFTAEIYNDANVKVTQGTANVEKATTAANFSGFGALTFNTTGNHAFTIKEAAITPATPGMTYDVGFANGHSMIVNVDENTTTNELYIKSVTIDGKTVYTHGETEATPTWLTITNNYIEPKKTFDLNNTIFKTFTPVAGGLPIPTGEGISYTFTARMTEQTEEGVADGNTGRNYTLKATLTGEVTEANKVPFTVEGANEVSFAPGTYCFLVREDATAAVTGTVNGTIHNDSQAYLLTLTVKEDLSFETEVKETAVAMSLEEPTPGLGTVTFNNTYEEKEPGKCTIDFSDFVKKELTATGSKTASDVNFTVNVKESPIPVINSTQGVEAVSTYAGELLSTTLNAHFDSITGGETKTTPFTGSVEITSAGQYIFELREEDGQRTGVTYDETIYTLHVQVQEKEGSLAVMHWYFTDSNRVEHNAGEKAAFHNTIDTGKDNYYPIIIPTIINKDTGMLNKTDHFAYVIGYPDGTVHPNGQITRAEVATIFFRLLRDEVRDGAFTTSNTYSDVAYGKWYNNPISTMSALGIITGYPDGTFKPNKPITRAEFAAIAARFDETQSGKSATFSDVIGHWAAKEIGIAYYNDWIKGYPDGTFKPDQNITRAEAMTLINRVLERKPESPADLLTNMNKWTDNMDTSKWYYLDVQEATNSHGYTRKTFNYELWRQMLPDPDWSRYER